MLSVFLLLLAPYPAVPTLYIKYTPVRYHVPIGAYYTPACFPTNTRRSSVGLMFGWRHRRRASIELTLGRRLVFDIGLTSGFSHVYRSL